MTDPIKQKATYRRYYIKHRDKIKARNLAYYYANKERCDARHKEYVFKNREKIRQVNLEKKKAKEDGGLSDYRLHF